MYEPIPFDQWTSGVDAVVEALTRIDYETDGGEHPAWRATGCAARARYVGQGSTGVVVTMTRPVTEASVGTQHWERGFPCTRDGSLRAGEAVASFIATARFPDEEETTT